MKKWHKWIIAIAVFIAAIVIALVCVYRFYAKDKIEATLEKAQTILQDEKVREEVEQFVDEMVEAGELNDAELEGYQAYKEAMVPVHTDKPVTTPKPKTLIERVRAEMTAEEFAFAMSVYGKLDINYCLANYHTNKKEVKKYIKSVLSSSEISRSLEIYGKYSYILK